MMNVASEGYKMFVDVDVPALEGHVLRLRSVLETAGRGELFVPLLRQLATVIAVPRLSMRLIAIASRWFMSSGRAEEAVLELDRLGDLAKVDDTLSLITATRIHDYSPEDTEQLLMKAVASAACKDEKWGAQLELAEHVFDVARKEEALRLVDNVISEASKSKHLLEGHPEALILRWRITHEAADFEAALKTMERGDESALQRYGGILIDEGKYANAELLLAGLVGAGDLVAKLLIIDARVRSGDCISARDLLLSVRPEQVSSLLKYAYAVACSIVALSSAGDAELRARALRAINSMPPSAQEGDKRLRTLVHALNEHRLPS
jgi:hypothetical protein